MSQSSEALRRAIKAVGTQAGLAKAIGSAQSSVSRMLNGDAPIEAETAIAIERATSGAVSRQALRPDLWPKDQRGRAA